MSVSHLTPSEQRGLLVLAIILLLFCVGAWWFSRNTDITEKECMSIDTIKSVAHYLDSMQKQPVHSHKEVETTLFDFDPNTADSATFVRLGLPHWIAGRIIHYRAAGGVFKMPQDFKKIYGLKEKDYQTLKNYIHIAPRFQNSKPTSQHKDTFVSHIQHEVTTQKFSEDNTKFKKEVQIDLNSTDSTQLTRIPGIGPYFAHRIIAYGQRLGGYSNISQLKEIKNFPEGLDKWFTIQTAVSKVILINRQDFKKLLSHPYLNFEQVKAIVNYREKMGKIHTLQELSNNAAFTESDFLRLEPYVNFE